MSLSLSRHRYRDIARSRSPLLGFSRISLFLLYSGGWRWRGETRSWLVVFPKRQSTNSSSLFSSLSSVWLCDNMFGSPQRIQRIQRQATRHRGVQTFCNQRRRAVWSRRCVRSRRSRQSRCTLLLLLGKNPKVFGAKARAAMTSRACISFGNVGNRIPIAKRGSASARLADANDANDANNASDASQRRQRRQ